MIAFIRWVLSVLLLIGVWKHAHWTVALCITLITVSVELLGEAVKNMAKLLFKITKKDK